MKKCPINVPMKRGGGGGGGEGDGNCWKLSGLMNSRTTRLLPTGAECKLFDK